jgi:hypothetical protein
MRFFDEHAIESGGGGVRIGFGNEVAVLTNR